MFSDIVFAIDERHTEIAGDGCSVATKDDKHAGLFLLHQSAKTALPQLSSRPAATAAVVIEPTAVYAFKEQVVIRSHLIAFLPIWRSNLAWRYRIQKQILHSRKVVFFGFRFVINHLLK